MSGGWVLTAPTTEITVQTGEITVQTLGFNSCSPDTYRDVTYVTEEVTRLAQALFF